jgi:hypothetical protein
MWIECRGTAVWCLGRSRGGLVCILVAVLALVGLIGYGRWVVGNQRVC